MMKTKPRVSIGMPVYNGDRFLKEALDSILAQTFTDFELIISDNASTDETSNICQEYAAKDSRIRYYRNPQNVGAAKNYNRVFELASGEYFKWAAHDDICVPEYLEKCVEILECEPTVVLCYSKTQIINEDQVIVENYSIDFKSFSPKVYERFYELTRLHHRCYQIFGVVRTSALMLTSLIGNYAGSDRVLLARLSLHGSFVEVPEYLFFARRHSQQSIEILFKPKQKLTRLHQYALWFDPANQGRILLPNWRIFQENLSSIRQTKLSAKEKLFCYGQMLRWLYFYWNWAKLGRDLLIAAHQIGERSYQNLRQTKIPEIKSP